MIKKYKQFNEGILNHLKGPSKEEISINLKKKYEEDHDSVEYMKALVRYELLYDIITLLYDLDDENIPFVIKYTYIYNTPNLRNMLWEELKINSEIFNKIKTYIKGDFRIKLLDNKEQIYNELDEIEKILKYRDNI